MRKTRNLVSSEASVQIRPTSEHGCCVSFCLPQRVERGGVAVALLWLPSESGVRGWLVSCQQFHHESGVKSVIFCIGMLRILDVEICLAFVDGSLPDGRRGWSGGLKDVIVFVAARDLIPACHFSQGTGGHFLAPLGQ